jgi:hypothetical protein
LKKEFNLNGFILKEKFLPKETIQQILLEIHKVFRNKLQYDEFDFHTTKNGLVEPKDLFEYYKKNKEGYIGCMRVIQKIPLIYSLSTSQNILENLKKIGLKEPIVSQEPLVMLNNKNTSRKISDWKTPIHQDWRSRQGSLNSVAIWIALVDITHDIGPIEIIPGSHKRGLIPAEKDEWFMQIKDEELKKDEFVSVPIKAGDAIIFSQFLIHKSGNNTSENFRYSIQYRYDDLLESNYLKRNYPNSRGSLPSTELITPNFPKKDDLEETFSIS